MRCVTICIFLAFVIVYAGADDTCPPSSLATTYSNLKTSLQCNYDAYLRPVTSHTKATSVSFVMILKYFTYDIFTGTLALDTWLRVSWIDEHLKWNPADYLKIESVYFDTYEIWTPDLSIFNRATEGGDPTAIGVTKCSVNSNGTVLCVPSLHIDSLCVPDLRWYPFDTQICDVRMGSWTHKGEELDLKLLRNIVITDSLEPNGEWEIDSVTTTKYVAYDCCPNASYPFVEIKLKISRLHAAHTATFVIPVVVAVVLTFTSLAIPPVNPERLHLCYINIIIQFVHAQLLSWQIPLRGDQIPVIILFARDSFLMAALTIIFTFILKYIIQLQIPAPPPVSISVSMALSNIPGRYLFLDDTSLKGMANAKGEEDGANIIDTRQSGSSDWKIFAKILNFIYIIAYIIAYLVLITKYVP